MLAWLILLFVGIPLVELFLLIRIAQVISPLPTLALVVVTGVVGASLARRQGMKTWARVQSDLSQGRMPTSEIVDALLIFIAGVVLITPGIITDVFGFCLLVPSIRASFKLRVAEHLRSRIVMIQHPDSPGAEDDIIDVEVTEASDVPPRSSRS